MYTLSESYINIKITDDNLICILIQTNDKPIFLNVVMKMLIHIHTTQ